MLFAPTRADLHCGRAQRDGSLLSAFILIDFSRDMALVVVSANVTVRPGIKVQFYY